MPLDLEAARQAADFYSGNVDTDLLGSYIRALADECERQKLDLANVGMTVEAAAVVNSALRARLAAIEKAAEPFVKTAAGIPDNWPGRCVYKFEEIINRYGNYDYGTGYLHEDVKGPPTIDDYRRLAHAVSESRCGDKGETDAARP